MAKAYDYLFKLLLIGDSCEVRHVAAFGQRIGARPFVGGPTGQVADRDAAGGRREHRRHDSDTNRVIG